MIVSLTQIPPDDVFDIITSRSDLLLLKMYRASGLSLLSEDCEINLIRNVELIKLKNKFDAQLSDSYSQRVNKLRRIVDILDRNHRQNWSKDLIAHHCISFLDIDENRRLDELVDWISFSADRDGSVGEEI